MCEKILADLCARHPDWSVTALRYFNPTGAHESGEIGEDPTGIPGNIVPFLTQLAAGRHDELQVFGSDYPTTDGTAVRDYIHVMDVVEGHRLALETGPLPGFRRYNLGTGVGTSVLELIREFETVTGNTIPYRIVGRQARRRARTGRLRRPCQRRTRLDGAPEPHRNVPGRLELPGKAPRRLRGR